MTQSANQSFNIKINKININKINNLYGFQANKLCIFIILYLYFLYLYENQ